MMELVINQQVDSLHFHLRKHLVQINISKHIFKVNSSQNLSHASYMFIKMLHVVRLLFLWCDYTGEWGHRSHMMQGPDFQRVQGLTASSFSSCCCMAEEVPAPNHSSLLSADVSSIAWDGGPWSSLLHSDLPKMGWISKGDGMIRGRY